MTSLKITREQSLYRAASDRAVQQRRLEMGRLQEQLSTGRRVNRASDDPTAFGQARRLESLGRRYAQYQRSIDAAQSWVDHTQDALDTVVERFSEAYERGLRATSPVFDAGARAAEADRLDAFAAEIADLLNARDGDEYVFAGTRTTAPPFTVAGTAVTYQGNDAGRSREIGDGLRLDVNVTGERVQDTGAGFTIFESLTNLAAALRTGDAAQMQAALGDVGTARDHVAEVGAEAGGIAVRLDQAGAQLRQAELRIEERRSAVEDTDVAAALVAFQQEQTGLQAALKVTASVLQTSLLDYLR